MRFFLAALVLIAIAASCGAQAAVAGAALDSDHDGLADVQESSLLSQFEPRFLISRSDCSRQPAEFTAFAPKPIVVADNGTIYGQAFPRPGHTGQVELHYYDLWRKDCGQRGHDLDTEHVSAVLSRDRGGVWRAIYWYASAHEDTLCDASQMARAASLNAETRGPEVWISSGKHAAFLGPAICTRGCGADRCEDMEKLSVSSLINLGEWSGEMNGASWTSAPGWPLAEKMRRSDLSDARTEKLDRLASNEIVWVNPGKRPAQAAIVGGDSAIAGVGRGMQATDHALTVADSNTGSALKTASDNTSNATGNALAKSYRKVKKALGAALPRASEPAETKTGP
jgi:hypothetical protein